MTVLTSRRAYDDPSRRFAKTETWRGVRIIRLGATGFGKSARWRRAADFASFLALCACRLPFVRRPDVVVTLTSPPLIAFLGAWLARLRRARFIYWIMDLNPDEALAAGWLRPRSLAARLLERLSRFTLRQADRVIALDRFMQQRIVSKGVDAKKALVLPPWSHHADVRFDAAGRDRFRHAHGLDGKFVVMYSGNHSPCHPLDTLLEAAQRLARDRELVFCFVGGGSEWRRLQKKGKYSVISNQCSVTGSQHSQINLLCLPYQPLRELSASLSAADLHVVVMGDPFVGLVHPCKIYNVLNLGAPILYIGPATSHVTELATALNGSCFSLRHDDVDGVVSAITRARLDFPNPDRGTSRPAALSPKRSAGRPGPQRYQVPEPLRTLIAKETLLPKLLDALEGTDE